VRCDYNASISSSKVTLAGMQPSLGNKQAAYSTLIILNMNFGFRKSFITWHQTTRLSRMDVKQESRESAKALFKLRKRFGLRMTR
jgi:hypothetical protein